MKKLLCAGLFVVLMMVAMTACGSDDGSDGKDKKVTPTEAAPSAAPSEEATPTPTPEAGLTQERYDAMTAEELLAEGKITDYENVTVEQCVWLVETYRFVNFRDEKGVLSGAKFSSKSTTADAIKLVKSGFPKKDEWNECMSRFFDSRYPEARAYGFLRFATITGLSEDNQKKVLSLIRTEEEPIVMLLAAEALKNDMAKDEVIAAFIFRASKAADYMIRNKAANALGCTASIGVPGVAERLIEMMKDENKNVRTLACTNCGHLNDPVLIEPLKAVLADPNEDPAVKAGACSGLAYLCYDYPMHANVSEDAWNALMAYYSTSPRGKNSPVGSGLAAIANKDAKKFDAWKEKASYYNPDAIFSLMLDIIKDTNADYLLRYNAINCAKTHGTAEQFASLAEVVNALDDNVAEQLKNAYKDAAAK